MKKNFILYFALIHILLSACQKEKIPVVAEWIGQQTKSGAPLEKTFRTTGRGESLVTWWAGGYTWEGGYFIVELVDVKRDETVLHKIYQYGDKKTGNDELPRFKWWHSEEKGRIFLAANRVYKMKLRAQGLAQPGAGWGLWLYEIGTADPKRHEGRLESHE